LTVIREAKRYKGDLPVIIITGFLHRVERDRSRQPRRRGLPHQALPRSAGARRRRQSPRRIVRSVDPAFRADEVVRRSVLFDHVTWQITDGERVGLCGPNGAGKTTLLKMMAGFDEPDSGAVLKPSTLTVGYLPQDGLAHSGRSLLDEATSAFGDLLAIKAEMHDVEDKLGDASIPQTAHDEMLARYSDLQDIFRHRDGYSIELKTATVLQGLGFKTADFPRL